MTVAVGVAALVSIATVSPTGAAPFLPWWPAWSAQQMAVPPEPATVEAVLQAVADAGKAVVIIPDSGDALPPDRVVEQHPERDDITGWLFQAGAPDTWFPRISGPAVTYVPSYVDGDHPQMTWAGAFYNDEEMITILTRLFDDAPPELLARLCLGGMVFRHEFPSEVLAPWYVMGAGGPLACVADPEESEYLLQIALSPDIVVLPEPGECRSAESLRVDGGTRWGQPWLQPPMAPLRGTIDMDAAILRDTEWDIDEAVINEATLASVAEEVATWQADRRIVRDLLQRLQTISVEFGGTLSIGDVCAQMSRTNLVVDPGGFADEEVRTTTGSLPGGLALESLAYSQGAQIRVSESNGLALTRDAAMRVPEPIVAALRQRATEDGIHTDIDLTLLALDRPDVYRLGDLPAWVQDLVHAQVASRGEPGTVSDNTQVGFLLSCVFVLSDPRMVPDGPENTTGTGLQPVVIGEHGDYRTGIRTAAWPHVLPDPFGLAGP